MPEPVKARILLEMAADLEALYDHYRERGIEEDEAARLTEERILASPESLRHLVAVHTTGYERWLGRAGEGIRWSLEVALLALGALPIVLVAAWAAAAQARWMFSDPLLWPLLGIGAAVAGFALWKGIQLFAGRACSTAELHRGLTTLLFLGFVGPLLGGIAFLARLYALAMEMADAPAAPVFAAAAEPLAQGAALLGIGLLLGIGAGLVWFVLVNRISTIERAESAALLAG